MQDLQPLQLECYVEDVSLPARPLNHHVGVKNCMLHCHAVIAIPQWLSITPRFTLNLCSTSQCSVFSSVT